MPKVSVVIPVHNERPTIGECLDSVLDQTFGDLEVVVVDDGSTDGSADYVSERAAADSRIRLVGLKRRGLVGVLNRGIAESRSDLIARMDADDRMHPERIALQYGCMTRNPAIALVGSRVRLFSDHTIRSGYREYVRWQNRVLDPDEIAREIYVESPFAHPSVMIRRDVIDRLGGYRDGVFPEDYDLWLRMFEQGNRMCKLPQTLLDWRDRPDRASRTDPRYRREAFDRLRASYLARDPRVRGAASVVIWGAGRRTRQRARHLLDLGIVPLVWIDIDPRKVGHRIDGVPVERPEWLAGLESRPFVLIYIARHGARRQVSEFLDRNGYRPGEHYLAVG